MSSGRDRDLPPVPAVDPSIRYTGSSTPLQPSSQRGQPAQEQSPAPVVPASAVPERQSSLKFKPASPPHIEEDYDQYRNMLAKSATGAHREDPEVFHDASEEVPGPTSRTSQQQARRDYGRHQSQATDGNDLNIQGLSIADDGTGNGRTSTERTPVNESNSNPIVNRKSVPTRKALPPRPQENINPQGHTLRHKTSDTDLQDQAQNQPHSSFLPKLDQHPQPSIPLPTTNDPNHTFTTSPHPDPLARLPPSFNPTNTVDTTVDTTIAQPVTHETHHTRRIEVVQEAITRDIHVDHYYHYVQPVKAVEVNPPQHFRINSKGEKLSIAPPEGWEMPSDLGVRKAPDFGRSERNYEARGVTGANAGGAGAAAGGAGVVAESAGPGGLGWTRRDYLVDEANPGGRMLNEEELESERVKGHLANPVGVGSRSGSGRGVKTERETRVPASARDNEPGIAR